MLFTLPIIIAYTHIVEYKKQLVDLIKIIMIIVRSHGLIIMLDAIRVFID